MNFCTQCGNAIKDKEAKFCTKCGHKLFYASVVIKGGIQNYDRVQSEDDAIEIILDDLGLDRNLFKIEKPSQAYTTLRYNNYDLFRIKYTNKARWIKIPMFNDMIDLYKDNPLFEAQNNKSEYMWKSEIKSLFDYKEMILKAIDNINAQKKN